MSFLKEGTHWVRNRWRRKRRENYGRERRRRRERRRGLGRNKGERRRERKGSR